MSTKSLEKIMQDQDEMVRNQMQLFENINLVVENLKYKSDHHHIVVKNQGLIIKNQEIIVDNQINIINNQKQIVDNQVQLLLINKLLTTILNELRNNTGKAESLQQTNEFVNNLMNETIKMNKSTLFNMPKTLND